MTNHKEKAKVLNTFFASVSDQLFFGCPAPELEDRNSEQSKAAIFQGEVISELPQDLDIHRCGWLGGIHPRVLRVLAEVFNKPLSIIYQQPM